MNAIHRGRIKNNKLELVNEERYKQNILSLEGKEIELTLKEHKSTRSRNQNRYYFGVVLKLIAEYTGHEVEEIHEIMKQKFIGQKGLELDGDVYFTSLTTTTLNTKAFEEYLESIRRWAMDTLEVQIPLPNEVEY